MKIVNVYVELKDIFSGATSKQVLTRSETTYKRMLTTIGKEFSRFDRLQQIRFDYKVINVRIAKQSDIQTNKNLAS